MSAYSHRGNNVGVVEGRHGDLPLQRHTKYKGWVPPHPIPYITLYLLQHVHITVNIYLGKKDSFMGQHGTPKMKRDPVSF